MIPSQPDKPGATPGKDQPGSEPTFAEPPLAARLPGFPPPRRPADGDHKLRQQLVRQVVAQNAAGQLEPAAAAAAAVARSEARQRAAQIPARRRRLALAAALPALLAAGYFAWWRLESAEPATTRAAPPAATAPGETPGEAPGGNPAPTLITSHLKPIGAEVLGLAIQRIVVDPGHGGSDTGTKVGGLSEKDLTLDIATRLRDLLSRQGFEVHLTRASDLTLTLRERSEMANLLDAHLFVSVHINYLPGGAKTRGVETYFVGATEDPELLELARRENVHSGYDMASNNRLLQKLYTDTRQQNSQGFAQRVQQLLFSSLKPAHPELVDRGVKQAPFVVLVGTTMPAILAEVACLSNAKDAELLARPHYRETIAEALARGIRRYADDVNPSQEKGS